MSLRRSLLVLGLLATAACASGGAGSALYRKDVGIASLSDAVSLGLRVVQRFQYEVQTMDTVPEIRILTHWKTRRPFADELALGITNAESRMLITGRPRGQTELGGNYLINFTLENRVRVAGSAEWNEATNTGMFRQHADEISSEYRQLITNIGVRRY